MGRALAVYAILVVLIISCHGFTEDGGHDLQLADSPVVLPFQDEFLDEQAPNPALVAQAAAAAAAAGQPAPTAAVGASAPAPTPAAPPTPAKVPPPAPLAPLPKLPPKQPTDLEKVLKQRKDVRQKREAHRLKIKFEEAQADSKMSEHRLQKVMAKVTTLETKIAESKSARDASKQQQHTMERKVKKLHVEVHLAEGEYHRVKKSEEMSAEMVDSEKVEKIVAGAQAQTSGGRDVNLKKAEEKRGTADERLKEADAGIVTQKLAHEKVKAALEAAKAGLTSKKEELKAAYAALRKADVKFSHSVYDIKDFKAQKEPLDEVLNERKTLAKQAEKKMRRAHIMANAAALKASNAPNAAQAEMKALLENPKEALREAKASAKDADGISKKGKPLVAPKGSLEKAFEKDFSKLPLPSNGENPILEAEATASLRDTTPEEASKVAQAPDVAAVAAKKSLAAGVTSA